MFGAAHRRRRGADDGNTEDDELHQGLLDAQHSDETPERPDDGPSSSGRSPPDPFHRAVDDLLRLLTDRLSFCAARLTLIFQWLFGGLSAGALTEAQLQKLASLRTTLREQFDHSDPSHEAALHKLWKACFPNEEWTQGPSPMWTEVGFQSPDPATDFRGGGIYALLNLLYMAEHHHDTFLRLMNKTDGERAEIEYPFCAAGINITFRLEEMFELRTHAGGTNDKPPRSVPGRVFAKLLETDDSAFEELYVLTFEVLDRRWLSTKASYMDFPQVINATFEQLKHAFGKWPASIAALRDDLQVNEGQG